MNTVTESRSKREGHNPNRKGPRYFDDYEKHQSNRKRRKVFSQETGARARLLSNKEIAESLQQYEDQMYGEGVHTYGG